MTSLRATLLAAALLWTAAASAVEKITLFALFHDQAVLLVDDQRHRLRTGEHSPEGVLLVATDTDAEQAVIEVDGQRRVLRLGIVFQAATTTPPAITLYADRNGFYHANGTINGVPTTFLVDTGANIIAMNSALAQRIGLDYTKGQSGTAMTAGGPVRMYAIRLDRVKLGAIELYNVDAGVIEGPQPAVPLLGMSFLNRLNLNQTGNRLELVQRY